MREYGYDVPDRAIEIINCRLKAVGAVPKAPLSPAAEGADASAARDGERRVYHGKQHGWLTTPVYDRERLAAGITLQGPAIIEEMSSTTVLAPTHSLRVEPACAIVSMLAAPRLALHCSSPAWAR